MAEIEGFIRQFSSNRRGIKTVKDVQVRGYFVLDRINFLETDVTAGNGPRRGFGVREYAVLGYQLAGFFRVTVDLIDGLPVEV